MKEEKGKILIEGMDLSGKTTITKYLSEILDVNKIQKRTLSDECAIYDFTVAQSKKGKLHIDLINKLYTLAISEDLYNYKPNDNGIILQDSYFALRSYALMKQKYPDTLAKEVYKLLQLFPKPELTFYLMEKLLISNPKEFEEIEKNLRDIITSLFDTEIINTEGKKPNEIALYIGKKIQEKNRENDKNIENER